MAKIYPFSPQPAAATSSHAAEPAAPITTPVERSQEELERYYNEHCIARRLKEQTIYGQRRIVERFLTFAGKPAWEVTPRDYERWMAFLVRRARPLKVDTHRYYQSAIAAFFGYFTEDLDYQNACHARHGVRLRSPLTARNRVIHRLESEAEVQVWSPTHKDVECLFEQIKIRIRTAPTAHGRLTAMRDLAVFAVQYYLGLRISEITSLNVTSFQELAATRELTGQYGCAKVLGKGSRGSGKKARIVPVVTTALPDVLTWYEREVRPKFTPRSHDARRAMFLNMRHERATADGLRHRLCDFMKAAGLYENGRSTHSLRRGCLTHVSEVSDMALAQAIAGHVHMATTQIYVRIPEAHIQARVRSLTERTAH